MKPPVRPLVVASLLLSVFFALAFVQSSSASFRKFHNFDGPGRYLGNICTDGFTISFADEEGDFRGSKRRVEVHADVDDRELISQELDLKWIRLDPTGAENTDNLTFTSTPASPFCDALALAVRSDFNRGDGAGLCADLLRVYWKEPLPPGTTINISYSAAYDDGEWYSMEPSCDAADPTSCITDKQAVVDDCRVGSNRIQPRISNLASSQSSTGTGSLAVAIEAEDLEFPLPEVANISVNGAGIKSVAMTLIDPFGTAVYSHVDSSPPYCLFGETEAGRCQSWLFADHNYTWPGGQPVAPGIHRVRASVDGYYSNDETTEWAIDVQRTYWQELRYLPLVEAHSSWPNTVSR